LSTTKKKPSKPIPVALRVELENVSPLVWRRIIVSNQWTLSSLHNYLQWVFGWQDTHAHEFVAGDVCIAPEWWIAEARADRRDVTFHDEKRVSIAAIVKDRGIGGTFDYLYDMGDDWTHRIVIEQTPAEWAALELEMPMCTAGENACPPDDVGGPHGYQHFIECISNPKSAERADMLRWVGGVFDPKGFDLNRLNRDWRTKRRRGGG
jgi:hypothetical protein